MNRVGVGRLGNQDVAAFHELRIAKQRQTAPAQVAGEDDSPHFAVILDIELNHGGAEDMAGVGEAEPQGGRKFVPVGSFEWLEQLDDAADVVLAIKRFDGGPIGRATAVALEVAGILLLDMQAVAEHDGGQVGRRRRTVNRTPKTGPKQAREIAAMVDVGMG